jgi:hypothetical protein
VNVAVLVVASGTRSRKAQCAVSVAQPVYGGDARGCIALRQCGLKVRQSGHHGGRNAELRAPSLWGKPRDSGAARNLTTSSDAPGRRIVRKLRGPGGHPAGASQIPARPDRVYRAARRGSFSSPRTCAGYRRYLAYERHRRRRRGVHGIAESPGAGGTTRFHPFASRLHHAAGRIHPICILDGGRAAIVYRIRAAFVCIVCRDKATRSLRTCKHAAAHKSLLGREK